MKKILIIMIFGYMGMEVAIAQDNATVYFLRNTGFRGSATAFNAFIDGAFVCRLNSNRYSVHEVAPGKRAFTVQFQGKKAKKKAEEITIDVEGGKTYYVQMALKTGIMLNDLYCVELGQQTAQSLLESLKEDKNCKAVGHGQVGI